MRRALSVVALISVAFATFALMAGPAGAATVITAPAGNPYAVPGVSGTPQAFTVTVTGFAPDTNIFIEQCDGVSPSAQGWSPTANCDNLTSPAPVISNGSGAATFDKNDLNHGFTPFKGEGPGGLFNCLSLNDPALSNGFPNYRNCKVRVSTNNAGVTGDQVFLNIQLPDASAPLLGCTIKGSYSNRYGLTNTDPTVKPKPKGNPAKGAPTGLTLGTQAGGACAQTVTTKFPIETGTFKVKGSVLKGAKCNASLTTPYEKPLVFSLKFQGTNPKTHKLGTVGTSVVTISSITSVTLPEVTYTAMGTVTKGNLFVGHSVRFNLVLDQSQLDLNTLCGSGSHTTSDSTGFRTTNFTGVVHPSTVQIS